jgi:hypothetical protein
MAVLRAWLFCVSILALAACAALSGDPASGELLPNGRPAALAYATAFIEEAKRDGTVRRALDNAGLRNAPVAPRQD